MFRFFNLSLALLFITWVTPNLAVKSLLDSKATGTNACIGKQTCHDCIQTPSCAWCSMPVRFYYFLLKKNIY